MVIFDKSSSERLSHNTTRSGKNLREATKRLSSGYRINSAADDAAGLAVSEKLRSIDRGLRQGLRNITDGIDFLDTVDGASQGIHDMLHRLEELAVQSSNGTYDKIDRGAMDLEYQQLLDEINQFTQSSEFNTIPLYDEHMPKYEFKSGNVVHNGSVEINELNDRLVLGYTMGDETAEYTVTLPHGKFGAEELADLIDTELYDNAPNLIIGVNSDRQFTLQAEPGTVEYISGSGAELFYNMKIGSSEGFLLGVTMFHDVNYPMDVVEGQNDELTFHYGNIDDTDYTITLPQKSYKYYDLIAEINKQLRANPAIPEEIEAVPKLNDEGKHIIGLKGDLAITGLSGNFLKIETKDPKYHSPLYDIRLDNDVDNTQAVFGGEKVIAGNVKVERGRNEFFEFNFSYYDDDGNGVTKSVRFDLLEDGVYEADYSAESLAQKIQQVIDDNGVPFKAEIKAGKVCITSGQYGRKCAVKLNTTNVPSQYMVHDFFDKGTLVKFTPSPSRSVYRKAVFNAYQNLRDNSTFIPTGKNTLTFKINVSGANVDFTHSFADNRFYTGNEIIDGLNQELNSNYTELSGKVEFKLNSNGGISLAATDTNGAEIKSITAGGTAYNTLIKGKSFYNNRECVEGRSSNYIISESPSLPNGMDTVSTEDGYTVTNNVTYSSGENSSSVQLSEDYINYTPIAPDIQQGTNEEELQGGVGSGENDTPAKMTLNGVLKQFSANGTSLRDIDFSFDLSDTNGDKKSYSVHIPKGSTSAGAVSAIQNALGSDASVQEKSGGTLYIESAGKGKFVKFTNVSGNLLNTATKSSHSNDPQSVVDYENNKVYVPAKLTLGSASTNIPYTVESGKNDKLILNYAGNQHTVTLPDNKEYTSLDAMKSDIENALSGSGITVRVNGGALEFIGDPKQSGAISVSNASNCTLNKKKVHSSYPPGTEFPASLTVAGSCVNSKLPIDVKTGKNDTITLDYTAPGQSTKKLTIKVAEKVYGSIGTLRAAVSEAIDNDPNLKDKISVVTDGSNLKFNTVNKGDGYKLGNIGGTMKIHLYEKHASTIDQNGVGGTLSNGKISFPGYIQNDKFGTVFTDGRVNINPSNKHVHFRLNGTEYEFDLDERDYTANDLITILGQKTNGAATVSLSGNTLTLISNNSSAGAVSVYGDDNSPIFKGASTASSPSNGSILDVRCKIDGNVSISSSNPVDLSYFNKMSFSYTDKSGAAHTVDVSVTKKVYDNAAELAGEIQTSIDNIIGAGNLEVVTFGGGRIEIKSAKVSNDVIIGNFEGGLFDRVFQSARYSGIKRHTDGQGSTDAENASCIIGRNDLQPQTAEEIASNKNVIIYRGLNDTMIFDFTFDSSKYKIEFQIPEGAYTPEELASAIEAQGRAELAKISREGTQINPEFFHATIGLAPIGLSYGENLTAFTNSDKLVLSYIVEDDGNTYTNNAVIDAIRGNSAYRVFYESTGQPCPSNIIGNSDLTEGLVIKRDKNDTLEFNIDGEVTKISIDEGYYTIKELAEKINEACEEQKSMVRAVDKDGRMMFYTAENGDYHFDKIMGNAADDIFYGGEGREKDEETIGIHTGRRTGSYIFYDKARISSALMRINTTGITTAERAQKALNRLNDAVNILTMCRTKTGAYRNRSERALERNTINIENMTQAESGIRDADIPDETMNLAKHQITQQVQAYLTQMNKENQQSVLNLLG